MDIIRFPDTFSIHFLYDNYCFVKLICENDADFFTCKRHRNKILSICFLGTHKDFLQVASVQYRAKNSSIYNYLLIYYTNTDYFLQARELPFLYNIRNITIQKIKSFSKNILGNRNTVESY